MGLGTFLGGVVIAIGTFVSAQTLSARTLVRDELVAPVVEHALASPIHMLSQMAVPSIPRCTALLGGLVEASD